MGPNLGIRIFSTPSSFNLIWKLGSPAATRSVSKATLGYSTSLTLTTRGSLRLTPSISGNVFAIPTPAASRFKPSMLDIMPGYCTIRSTNSGRMILTPTCLGGFLDRAAGTELSTTGFSCRV